MQIDTQSARYALMLESSLESRIHSALSSMILSDGDICVKIPYGYDSDYDPEGIIAESGLADEHWETQDYSFGSQDTVFRICMTALEDRKIRELMEQVSPDEAARGITAAMFGGPEILACEGLIEKIRKAIGQRLSDGKIDYDMDERKLYCDVSISRPELGEAAAPGARA